MMMMIWSVVELFDVE